MKGESPIDTVTFGLLKLFNERSSLSLTDLSAILNTDVFNLTEPIKYMIQENLIRANPNISALESDELTLKKQFIITHLGRATLETELKSKQEYKYKELRSWITLVIAVLAFIKSFFY